MAKTRIMQKSTAQFFSFPVVLLCLVASLGILGCGAKGPLYQTPEPAAEPVQESEPANDDKANQADSVSKP